jgi:DNA replication and repair protein RecF
MSLTRLTLSHFRNHAETRLEDPRTFNLLVGENGAGKTNVLEAISLLAPGRGLRRAALAEMAARNAATGFAVAAELEQGEVALGTASRPESPNRRTVRVNGAEKPATALAEWLSLAWLTPAMDRLFAEGASARRRFLDRLVLARDPGHARQAARYDAALRDRNRLIAEAAEPDPAWLDAIEAQLAVHGAALVSARHALVQDLSEALAALPDQPFARPALAYEGETPADEAALAAALRQGRARDRAAGRTLTGPHRDDLTVTLAAKAMPAAAASTGEQKAMLVSIVLAHASLAGTGQPDNSRPRLILLDEIAAHLDPLRREALFDRLAQSGAQVWMTGTEAAPFEAITDQAAVWRVRDGTAERL